MRRHYGRVAWVSFISGVAGALWMLASTALAVDGAEAERRGFQALKVDPAGSMHWFEQAASAGRPAAQWFLGRHYFDVKGEARDPARALELIRAAASQGLAPAQAFLGWLYFNGIDVERDHEQAFAWISAAARQEDAFALDMLAGFYMSGLVKQQDREFAKRLLLRAAELGDLQSSRTASVLMLFGPTREPGNARLAIHFLTKAANGNDARACYLLAREYLRGTSVQQDPATAAQWLQRSSEGGEVLGSLWLSELHFKGLGVARDRAKAEQLLGDALTRASMQEKNQFAWDLSVGKDEKLRDGLLAVRVLEPALAAAAEKVTAHVDTLAAAYAEAKRFDRAVVTQLSAIERARRQRSSQEMIEGMEARLRLYERGEPYREIRP